jgi:hypothetical protein
MSGNLLLALLLATGVAQTDKKSAAENGVTAAEAQQKKTESLKGQKKEAPAKTKTAQEVKAEVPAETKKAQPQTDAAQAKTEAAPEKTEAAPQKTESAQAQTEEPQADTDPKLTSVPGGKALGMSILGNQEAPTSLVIVPWKSSEVGRAPGISPMLDDSRQPVDKEVFMRELRYYEIRSEKKP